MTIKETIQALMQIRDDVGFMGPELHSKARTEAKECIQKAINALRDNEDNTSLTLTASVDLSSPDGCPVLLVWSGNTKENKEVIRNLGYRWGVRRSLSETADDDKKSYWYKTIPIEEIMPEIKQAAKVCGRDHIVINISRAKYNHLLKMPKRPACVPAGKWNGQIYGGRKSGFKIWVDEKMWTLSNRDAEAVKAYIEKYAEWEAGL